MKKGIFILLCCLSSLIVDAQSTSIEAGVGIGNITGTEHTLGKGEVHLSLFQQFRFGALGLDFSTGGNFIPGERSTKLPELSIINPNDTKFNALHLLYRLPLFKGSFLEPRIGYSSLYTFTHSMEKNKVSQGNWSAGLGIGTFVDRVNFNLRYQYYGQTADFMGTNERGEIQMEARNISMIILGINIRWDIDNFFK